MMDLSESGPLEIVQVGVLALTSCAFLFAALKTRRPGAPALAVFSLVGGVAALREYSAGSDAGWQVFMDSHAARWTLASLLTVPLLYVWARDRSFGLWAHIRSVAPMVPVFLSGIALVWLAAAIEEWSGTVTLTAAALAGLLLAEEALELVAYGITFLVSLRASQRARQHGTTLSSLVTIMPPRRRGARRLFGRA